MTSPTSNILGKVSILSILLAAGLFSYALYLVFLVVPNERVMGPVQRIFYFHVGAAFACYLAFAVVFICGILYLSLRSKALDALAESASEVGFVFCSACLVTGMVWGYSAWNTPFRLEPRLVSTLLLWFIFLGVILLRAFGDPERVKQHAAVLGILGALMVPVVIYSIQLLPQYAQLHPQVVERQGLRDPLFYSGFYAGSLACISLAAAFILLRFHIALLERNATYD